MNVEELKNKYGADIIRQNGVYVLTRLGVRDEELFELFDENDEPVKVNDKPLTMYRSECHAEKRIGDFYHRGTNVFVLHNNQLYIPKRSADKDVYPGCYDVSISEHNRIGESYHDAAIRGGKEELGITLTSLIQLFKLRIHGHNNVEHAQYYFTTVQEPVHLSTESSSGEYYDLDEVRRMLQNDTLNFRQDHLPAFRRFLNQ